PDHSVPIRGPAHVASEPARHRAAQSAAPIVRRDLRDRTYLSTEAWGSTRGTLDRRRPSLRKRATGEGWRDVARARAPLRRARPARHRVRSRGARRRADPRRTSERTRPAFGAQRRAWPRRYDAPDPGPARPARRRDVGTAGRDFSRRDRSSLLSRGLTVDTRRHAGPVPSRPSRPSANSL